MPQSLHPDVLYYSPLPQVRNFSPSGRGKGRGGGWECCHGQIAGVICNYSELFTCMGKHGITKTTDDDSTLLRSYQPPIRSKILAYSTVGQPYDDPLGLFLVQILYGKQSVS